MDSDARQAAAATILDVPLLKEDEAMMLLTGFAYRAEDGILTLTDKGDEWVREWCAERRKALDGAK